MVAQHFHHLADGVSLAGGVFDDLCHDQLARFGDARKVFRDEYLLGEVFAVGYHKGYAPLPVEFTHDLLRTSFQYLNQAGFLASAPVNAAYTDHDAVIVHDSPHFLGREE